MNQFREGFPDLPQVYLEREVLSFFAQQRREYKSPTLKALYKNPASRKWLDLHNKKSLEMYDRTYEALIESGDSYHHHMPWHRYLETDEYKAKTVRNTLIELGLRPWIKKDFWESVQIVERRERVEQIREHQRTSHSISAVSG